MHAVVNTLRLSVPVDREVWDRAADELGDRLRGVEGFRALHAIGLDDDHVVLVILADDAAALDAIASDVGNTWMRANVVPHLAAPPDRRVGEVLASIRA